MNRRLHWPAALLLSSLVSTPLAAADYAAWNSPDTDTRTLVKELRQLVDKADDASAADPTFLRDLRKLASRYDKPQLRTLFTDDFKDGDYSRNPSWQVVDGKFWIDPNTGLRSQVEQSQSHNDTQQSSDIGNALLGALLNELEKKKSKKETKREKFRNQPAVIRHDQRIANAFVMRAELVSKQRQGHVDFALYQDSNKLNGYRLRYTPGSRQSFQLLRVTERGEAVIDAYYKEVNLEDNHIHALEWRRDHNGKMTLKLNDVLLFSTADSRLKEGFKGFALINDSGDYSLRRISLSEVY